MVYEYLDKVISALDIRNKWFRVKPAESSFAGKHRLSNMYHLCPIDKERYFKIENDGSFYETIVWQCDLDEPIYIYMRGMLEDIILGRLEIIDRKDDTDIFGNYAYTRGNVNGYIAVLEHKD